MKQYFITFVYSIFEIKMEKDAKLYNCRKHTFQQRCHLAVKYIAHSWNIAQAGGNKGKLFIRYGFRITLGICLFQHVDTKAT